MLSRIALILALSLPAAGASAQELPSALDDGQAELRSARIVIVITRRCRWGRCVRQIELRRVVERDTEADLEPVELSDDAVPQIADPNPAAIPAPAPAPMPAPVPAPAPAPSCGNAQETEAWRLLNVHRAGLGLSVLQCDLTALRVARAHSLDMCSRRYFDHYTPEGAAPWDRLRRGGARFSAAGENIAMGQTSASWVHQSWLDSPGHRQNIESSRWTRAAVGMQVCGETYYWTQLFAK